MIDYEEIRKELAVSHNALIAKDDPILIAATLHELMFQKYVEILSEKNDKYRKAIEAAQQKGIADAKTIVNMAITEGGNYVNEQAKIAVNAALDEGIKRIRKEMAETKKEVQEAMSPMQHAKGVGIILVGTFLVVCLYALAMALLGR